MRGSYHRRWDNVKAEQEGLIGKSVQRGKAPLADLELHIAPDRKLVRGIRYRPAIEIDSSLQDQPAGFALAGGQFRFYQCFQ